MIYSHASAVIKREYQHAKLFMTKELVCVCENGSMA